MKEIFFQAATTAVTPELSLCAQLVSHTHTHTQLEPKCSGVCECAGFDEKMRGSCDIFIIVGYMPRR